MSVKISGDRDSKQLGEYIDAERRKKRITQERLADASGCNVRTLRRVIRGQPVRFETINSICKVLKIDHESAIRRADVAGDEHGGYTLKHYEAYLGDFFAYRRSFTLPNALIRSKYQIAWDSERNCLAFKENQKLHQAQVEEASDYSQSGEIFISNTIGLLHLLTRFDGALRLVTLKRLDPESVTLGGIVLTQAQAPYFRPSVSPVLLRKITDRAISDEPKIIDGADPEYLEVNTLLVEIERNVASFATMAKPTE